MHIETLAVHAGRRADPATGAIAPPIYLSTTFERARDGEYPLGFSYSRDGNPNRACLEECLAALEGGAEALAFSSGMAAANAVIQGLEPGDHIIAPDDVYYGLRRLIGEVFGKWRLDVSYVDMSDLDAVNAAVRPNTRLVWVETPSNPLLKITDLPAIAAIARRTDAVSVCDGTFATPILQRPLAWGIDMVVHSTTKYIGGHSDVLGGALISLHQNYLFERARKSQQIGGAAPSPFDCWLVLRGVDTLPCRVRAQAESAGRIAAFLKSHEAVEVVHYPGLAEHPGHAVAARQMTGFGGMLSMQLRGGRERAMQVAAHARIFTRATSLGGTHSLIEHRASVEGAHTRTPQNLLRISVGLENVEDLIGDLAQALQ
ncbi:MAG: aminotransferase class I/II-fold pyridoxal phosphate-dependent enzyme [Bryobacteraceae bacterium]|jgi:cystathionine gamma-synthase